MLRFKIHKLQSVASQITLWDLLGISLIVAFAVVLFAGGSRFFLDDWYHLAVARVISDTGAIPTWDFWEMAPVGRPHLYPPLMPLVIVALRILTGNLLTAGMVAKLAGYPILLASSWYATRNLAGPIVGFVTILGLTTTQTLLTMSEMLMPATWVLAMTPLIFYTFLKKRFLTCTLLTSAALWTHIAMPWLSILALLLFSLLKRAEYLRFFAKVLGVSLLAYSPWLLHVAVNLDWLDLAHMPVGSAVPVIVWILAVPALGLAFKERRIELILALYLVSLAIIIPWYGHRFWPYSLLPIAFFAGMTISKARCSRQTIIRVAGLVLTVIVAASAFSYSPSIHQGPVDADTREASLGSVSFAPSAFTILSRRAIKPEPMPSRPEQARLGPDGFDRRLLDALIWIDANTDHSETVALIGIGGPEADAVTALTGRPTTGGMWREAAQPDSNPRVRAFIRSEAELFLVFLPGGGHAGSVAQVPLSPRSPQTIELRIVGRFGPYVVATRPLDD